MENLLDLLRNRRSTRVFKETQISPELVELLMKAVLMAPSSKRSNPWQFVLVDDPLKLRKLAGCKKSGAQLLANVPLAVVVLADPDKSDVWVEDASIASILLQLEAEDLGLGSCWVQIRKRQNEEGLDSEVCVRNILNIPESLAVLSIIAIGVKAESRKPFEEAKLQWEKIHLNAFGQVD